MTKDDFDKLFDEKFEEAIKKSYQATPPPDPTISYNKLRKKMEHEKRKRKWLLQSKIIAASVLLMITGAFIFGNAETKAFSPLFKMIQVVKSEVIQFFIGTNNDDSSDAKTSPPPDNDQVRGPNTGGVSIRKQVPLEEANNELSFEFYIPETIPEKFELKRVELYYEKGNEKAHMIELWYEGINGLNFAILQHPLTEDISLSSGIEKDAGISEDIQVNGYPSLLASYTDGRKKLRILLDNVYIELSGNINDDDLIAIAESLK